MQQDMCILIELEGAVFLISGIYLPFRIRTRDNPLFEKKSPYTSNNKHLNKKAIIHIEATRQEHQVRSRISVLRNAGPEGVVRGEQRGSGARFTCQTLVTSSAGSGATRALGHTYGRYDTSLKV